MTLLKKEIFNLIACFLLVGSIAAQTSTSRVVYHANHKLDTKTFNGQNTLHFNHERSLFVHDGVPKKSSRKKEGNNIVVTSSDSEGFPQFINFKDSLTYTKLEGYFGLRPIVKEKLIGIPWQILEEQKKIKNYNCIKAIAEFEGRQYIAWFSPEIPVPFGPYRLQGLPGLILEAHSEDDVIHWEFVGFEEQSTVTKELLLSTDGDIYELDEFLEAKLNIKRQKESQSTSEITVTMGQIKGDYNVEKDKFNIFEDKFNIFEKHGN